MRTSVTTDKNYHMRCRHCELVITAPDKYAALTMMWAHRLAAHGEEKTSEGKELLIF